MIFFCCVYYILSYIAVLPQVIKLLKTKSSNDYSLGMLAMQFIGLASWTIYIFTSNQNIIVCLGAVIDLLLIIVADILILKYYKL